MDIESEDFFKRIALAYKLIESRDDEAFRYWSNILLSDALVISAEMLSRIIRVPEEKIFNSLSWTGVQYYKQRSFPIALIPKITEKIDDVCDLFWYRDKENPNQKYSMPASELPQYLYFLMTRLNTPERTKGYDIKQINEMLPDRWRKNL